jgi:hypothetical protein
MAKYEKIGEEARAPLETPKPPQSAEKMKLIAAIHPQRTAPFEKRALWQEAH